MVANAPTTTQKLRALPWSLAGGAANSIFAQLTFFGSVFVLFLDEMNISSAQIGFLLSLLPFMGLVALFIAPAVARFGYKRTFVTFYALRKGFTALLLLVPWVSAQFGPQATLTSVALIVIGFGLSKSIAETGYFPWVQEFIPGSIRGKYSATSHVFASLTAVGAVALASYVLGLAGGLERFQTLFAVGVVFGVSAVWFYSHVPGGAKIDVATQPTTYRDMLRTVRDGNLMYYLAGIALITFGTGPLYSFLPLFMETYVGLEKSQVVLLSTASLIGGLLLSNLLGWSADRYGSKPVMMLGVSMMVMLPVGWLLMPRATGASLIVALAIALFQGIAGTAWMVGSGRLLFVSVVPDSQKSQYMAVYYAAIGLMGGVSQLVGGGLLSAFEGISSQLLFVTLDPFTPLLLAGIALPALSFVIFRNVRADSEVTLGEYAGMFVHGNPIYALENLVRYSRARDERSMVVLTERLGLSRSPLTMDELLEALTDPRFNVRLEAVISISRMQSHPRLTRALSDMVLGTELSLSNVAAWALGRAGDLEALPALHAGLDSEYRSVRASCARALGTLKDQTVRPLLLERLHQEPDKGLQMAYAAALGNLQAHEAIGTIHDLMTQTTNESARMDLALSLARMVGQENRFVNLLRQVRSDPATASAQVVLQLRQRIRGTLSPDLLDVFNTTSEALASEDMELGANRLAGLIRRLPPEVYLNAGVNQLLHYCADDLEAYGPGRSELMVLVLHVLSVGVQQPA